MHLASSALCITRAQQYTPSPRLYSSAQVEAQEGELLSLVAELRGFAGLEGDAQAGIRCRRTVQQLLAAFRRLGAVLRGVLAPGVLVEVAARLVQAVCSRIIGELVEAGWGMAGSSLLLLTCAC